ncbi:hypothetical protein J5837_00035 [Pseudoxanthomonas helianthi]|uniref:Bacteriocin n=1 Tax=Pseudoxanthomonas helianthi TaxID=1453541 RepID=A0A940WWG9_9GAMM|nr:hypothetical protein [Pseudoxanthomonas helianthi]MBP3982794.1 hypothetical protein [Pseudoxanthomonas helianthi]
MKKEIQELSSFEVDQVSGGDEMTYEWGSWLGRALRGALESMPALPTTYIN